MPSTRRASLPPSGPGPSTPLRTPAIDRIAPPATRSTRSARASSSTPPASSQETHDSPSRHVHHTTADEQMLLEAEKFLTKSAKRLLRSEGSVSGRLGELGSPRDRRHAKINEAREKDEGESMATSETRENEDASAAGGEEDLEDSVSLQESSEVIQLGSEASEPDHGRSKVNAEDSGDQKSAQGGNDDETTGGEMVSPVGILADGRESQEEPILESISGVNDSDIDNTVNNMDGHDQAVVSASLPAEVDGDDGEGDVHPVDLSEGERSGSSSASSSDSGSDSDSDSSEESDSDSETDASEDSDAEEERLEKLLQAAKISALAKQQAMTTKTRDADEETGEVVLQFDEEKKEAPIPDLSIPALPKAHISFKSDGSAQASSSASVLPSKVKAVKKSVKGKERATELEVDDRPYERQLSKRERASQPKKASASELWATLPSARADALPQMKRDYQALALANSLDPKRFMKGGTKTSKVPERFAIGTMVDQPRHLQDTTLAKTTQYRPGQIVQSIVQDEGLGATAKRKYGDLQWKRMENGRGKGWKKRTKW